MTAVGGANIKVIKYLTDLGVSSTATIEVHIIDVSALVTVPKERYIYIHVCI